jgi:hypothetical protein
VADRAAIEGLVDLLHDPLTAGCIFSNKNGQRWRSPRLWAEGVVSVEQDLGGWRA